MYYVIAFTCLSLAIRVGELVVEDTFAISAAYKLHIQEAIQALQDCSKGRPYHAKRQDTLYKVGLLQQLTSRQGQDFCSALLLSCIDCKLLAGP